MSESCPNECMINAVIVHSENPSQNVEIGPMPHQSENDLHLLHLWLHGRSPHTQRAYRTDLRHSWTFVGNKALHQVTLGDLQRFSDHLVQKGLESTSQHRILAAVRAIQDISYIRPIM